ncbi:MAG: DUF3320 domain-containing protein, partial [Phormidesmis sp. FL-bin-119]|nr:DUF3320 domain-containing protein [Pedobacter sp.]
EYILGILCDGNNYHSAKTAKDREIIQQEVLKLLGWNIHKIWSTDWWENANRVMDDTIEAIKRAEENMGKIIEAEPVESYTPALEKTEPLVFNNFPPAEVIAVESKSNFAGNLYPICNLDIVRSTSSDDFLQYHNTQKIKDQIKQVLDIEAPIMRILLAKRVLSAWGISKLGARINAQFEKLLSESNLKQSGKAANLVFWNNTQDPTNYADYRVATSSGQKRDAEDIPEEEIANGIKDILSHQVSLPIDDLVRETSKLFGFARSGANVEIAMRKGIAKAIGNGYVLEKYGRVVFI